MLDPGLPNGLSPPHPDLQPPAAPPPALLCYDVVAQTCAGGRPPVLLLHGFGFSAGMWVVLPPGRGLPYLLADQGAWGLGVWGWTVWGFEAEGSAAGGGGGVHPSRPSRAPPGSVGALRVLRVGGRFARRPGLCAAQLRPACMAGDGGGGGCKASMVCGEHASHASSPPPSRIRRTCMTAHVAAGLRFSSTSARGSDRTCSTPAPPPARPRQAMMCGLAATGAARTASATRPSRPCTGSSGGGRASRGMAIGLVWGGRPR